MDDDREGEVVHEGWLIKSPPLETKTRQIFSQTLIQPKWRRRWFQLRAGSMPGQFILQYYVDNTARKLKGSVDLDQCEQVDSGLTFECGKVRFQYMFDIRTPRRVYYLAADTEEEMTSWVDLVCRVCGLHNYSETQGDKDSSVTARTSTKAPVTQQPEISGPYMHLSECFTGSGSGRDGQMRRLARLDTEESSGLGAENSSTLCGDDSVFLPASPASVKSLGQKMSSMSVSGAPGRPPKHDSLRQSQPPRTHGSNEIYENHEEFSKMTATPLTNRSEDTKYESNNNCEVSTSAVFYPPTVDRRLKPERSVAPGLTTGPPVQRRRKPTLQLTGSGTWHGGHGRLSPGPGLVIPPGMSIPPSPDIWDDVSNASDTGSLAGGRASSEEQIYFYMPSLNTQTSHATDGSWNPIMIPASELHENAVEYLDLDLPTTDSSLIEAPGGNLSDRQHNLVKEKETVYKTVDFVKTEAFNRTRQKVEEYKYNIRQEN